MSVWTCGSKNISRKCFSLYSSVTSKVRSWECFFLWSTHWFLMPTAVYPAHQKHRYLWVECVKQHRLQPKAFTYPSYGQRLVEVFASWKPKSPGCWPVQYHVLWHFCFVLFSFFLKVELGFSVQSLLIWWEICSKKRIISSIPPTLDELLTQLRLEASACLWIPFKHVSWVRRVNERKMMPGCHSYREVIG